MSLNPNHSEIVARLKSRIRSAEYTAEKNLGTEKGDRYAADAAAMRRVLNKLEADWAPILGSPSVVRTEKKVAL